MLISRSKPAFHSRVLVLKVLRAIREIREIPELLVLKVFRVSQVPWALKVSKARLVLKEFKV
jgi:hypothetical protein